MSKVFDQAVRDWLGDSCDWLDYAQDSWLYCTGPTKPLSKRAQEQIDAWYEQMERMYGKLEPTTPKGCNHSWKQYCGFTEAFEYCCLCNERRDK